MTERYTLADLRFLMRRLRDPKYGCPWDLKQTLSSIVPHTLEESYELADAIERNDIEDVRQELGDLLFQVVFYAQLGEESGDFGFDGVVDGIVRKLLRRHPHVFTDGDLFGPPRSEAPEDSEIRQNWERIKARERRHRERDGTLDDVPTTLPALSRAAKLQKRAAQVGFDRATARSELEMLREGLDQAEQVLSCRDESSLQEEIGDLLFSCVNLGRHCGVDPEIALRAANTRFESRFRYIEAVLNEEGKKPEDVDLDTLDGLWERARTRG